MIVGGAALVGIAAVGGWMVFGPSGKAADTQASAVLPPEVAPGGAPVADKPGAVAPSQVDRLLAEVGAGIANSEGAARESALRDGYKKLVPLLEAPLPPQDRARAIEVFHPLTRELFLNTAHNEFSSNYVVKSGDSFDRIAARAGISVNLLYDLNGLQRGSKKLHPNDNLKLPKGKPRVVVRKGDFCASLYFGEFLVRQYVIAHGKNNNTPVGKTTVLNMEVDPEARSQGPNDPRGEMKLRWIGLSPYAGGRTGFGFHGTQYPDSIPGMTSKGCVRMKDSDVIELYDILRPGVDVEIKA
jgi:LysM repeat protein